MTTGPERAEGPFRTIRHLSLHRIGKTELRVVADVEVGVLSLVQAEESVVRGYAQQKQWLHRWVDLFVLQDLQPLLRQHDLNLLPESIASLKQRPVVNVYDLADPARCHVFVNQQAMEKEDYWGDASAMRGLLAHEHAHPLAENETAQASRHLQVDLSFDDSWVLVDAGWTAGTQDRVQRLLASLVDELCIAAPREVFANEVALRSGFAEELFYLDRRNVAYARQSIAGRGDLRRLLQQEMDQGRLGLFAADLLLLIGDMKGYLNLALETAAFYRTGQGSRAQELENVLKAAVFPYLEPEVPLAYTALRERYAALHATMTPAELAVWGQEVLSILTRPLTEKGQGVHCHLQIAE